MPNARILIEGKKVQEAGYRLFLLQKALENGIQKFYTRNINTNKIETLISDEQTKINRFYETIKKEKPKQATVNHIKKEPYDNKIPIPTIDRYLNFLALEQLTKGREEVSKIGGEITTMGEKISEIPQELSKIGKEITEIGEKITEIPEKTINTLIQKIKKLE